MSRPSGGSGFYGFDSETGEVVEREVIATFKNFTYYWVDVEIEDEIVAATRRHLFWVESANEWIPALDLERGMLVRCESGTTQRILSVSLRELPYAQDTYNLEVQGVHNYFVGKLATLVHNGQEKSVEEMAAELAKTAGQNRVSGTTAGGKQVDIDLQGKGHFDKATGKVIETPHVHESEISVGPNGEKNIDSKSKTTRPATKQDIRTAERLNDGC
ncbi:MAG: HINT domain-containing protein [Planctomycetes bacterium]|nr:HINT domain-containing protein [Planctomycetota bacterium]